jgi:hypothetical protein
MAIEFQITPTFSNLAAVLCPPSSRVKLQWGDGFSPQGTEHSSMLSGQYPRCPSVISSAGSKVTKGKNSTRDVPHGGTNLASKFRHKCQNLVRRDSELEGGIHGNRTPIKSYS